MIDGILRCPPGPTDAELQADRDAKHDAAVREWFDREIAEAHRRGWCDAFAAVQEVLQSQIDEAAAKQQRLEPDSSITPALQLMASGERITLLALSETLARLANGRHP